jgi:cell division protein FtsB
MQGVIVRIAVSVFGFATLAMLLLALYNDKGYFAVRAQALKLKTLQENNKTLEIENTNIRVENKALDQADPEVIEKHGREDLGLVKPNEMIFDVIDEPAPDSPPANKN